MSLVKPPARGERDILQIVAESGGEIIGRHLQEAYPASNCHPARQRLEEKGFLKREPNAAVDMRSDGNLYRLTDRGEQYVREHAERWQKAAAELNGGDSA